VENLWSNGQFHAIDADERTIDTKTLCGWKYARRVGAGCAFGRVVLPPIMRKVNSKLGSLTSHSPEQFASKDSNAPEGAVGAPTGANYRCG
jgi:hypothetical protein